MNNKEYKPSFKWWLISIILASGLGSGLSTYALDKFKEITAQDANLKIVEVDLGRFTEIKRSDTLNDIRIIIKNSGDKIGIVRSVFINEKKYDKFFTSHNIGTLRGFISDKPYLLSPAGFVPANSFMEIVLERENKKIESIGVEIENGKIIYWYIKDV